MEVFGRDAWAWRGGLARDEIDYSPVLSDARREPIFEPAHTAWPVLDTHIEAALAAVPYASAWRTILGPATAHLALCGRTGGYHAVVGGSLRQLERRFGQVVGRVCEIASFSESLNALEQAGVIERSGSLIALKTVPRPPAETLLANMELCGRAGDDEQVSGAVEEALGRYLAAARRQTQLGVGARRYRELGVYGRLGAVVSDRPGGGAGEPSYAAGGNCLPVESFTGLPSDLGLVPDRSLVSGEHLVIRRAADADTDILISCAEVGALVFGDGVGVNALRRAIRAAGIWGLCVLLAEGKTRRVSISLSGLSQRAADLFGLNPAVDHRTRVRQLCSVLEGVGSLDRAEGGFQPLSPPGCPPCRVRRFAAEWATALGDPSMPESVAVTALAEQHLKTYMRPAWQRLLEQRRVAVTVLPEQREVRNHRRTRVDR